MATDVHLLRVSASSAAPALAAAIAHGIYDHGTVHLRTIGASALNQAVKAIAIAQSYVGQRGLVLSMRPGFETLKEGGRETTAIRLKVWAQD